LTAAACPAALPLVRQRDARPPKLARALTCSANPRVLALIESCSIVSQ